MLDGTIGSVIEVEVWTVSLDVLKAVVGEKLVVV